MKKRFFVYITGLSLLSQFVFPTNITFAQSSPFGTPATGKQVICVITGYYSPLLNQNRYVTGSYKGDIRLNGRGTNGADGTEVFPGMIAAPKSVPFGTQVEIPGYGTGTVHDRGGAIITYQDAKTGLPVYRFDIWLGHGDVGLQRALNVGVRKKTCTLYPKNSRSNNIQLTPVQVAKSVPIGRYSNETLSSGDQNTYVKNVQEDLQALGYLQEQPTGFFGEQTLRAVIDFQVAYKVIPYEGAFGTGHVGSSTKATLLQAMKDKDKGNPQPTKKLTEEKPTEEKTPETNNTIQDNIDQNTFIIAAGLGKNASGQDVKNLQIILKQFNYYQGEINGVYDLNTIDAVLEFQKDQGIIEDENDYGAGYFGEKTTLALIKLLNQGIAEIKNASQNIITAQKKYSDLKNKPVLFAVNKKGLKPYITKKKTTSQKSSNFQKSYFVFDSTEVNPSKQIVKFDPFNIHTASTKVYAFGDNNKEIQIYQEHLNKLGFLNAIPTGYYGPLTEKSVIAFQKQYNIISSEKDIEAGIIGPKTQQKIREAIEESLVAIDN